jgi:hypothetical protein
MLKKNKKFNKLKLTLFLVLIVLFFSPCLSAGKFFGVSEAKASGNVHGYAWFQNIGWVSLSYLGPGGPADYGVNIEPNGAFFGYAWSPNMGWIDFSPEGPYPADPTAVSPSPWAACLDLPGDGQTCDGAGDYTVTGWIRACSVFNDYACGTTADKTLDPNAGGWDGWIKLNNIWIDTSVSPAQFHYWAWSDNGLGWGTFNCSEGGTIGQNICGTSNYKVVTTFPFVHPGECGSAAGEYPSGSTDFGDNPEFCYFGTPDPVMPNFPSCWVCSASE